MYLAIFDEIVDILHHDYAGHIDKQGWDKPYIYRERLIELIDQGECNEQTFLELVQDYLLDFKDFHMGFRFQGDQGKTQDVGFTVRRYQEQLHVVSTSYEEKVAIGDIIHSLDGVPVKQLVGQHKRILIEENPERENWESVLKKYRTAQIVKGSGEVIYLDLQLFDKKSFKPEYSFRNLDKETNLLTCTDFMDPDAIAKLLRENEHKITTTPNLIIDVRLNRGGSDLAYMEILPYLFNGGYIDVNSLAQESIYTLCTERNVDLRVQLLNEILEQTDDTNLKHQISHFISELKKHRGKGFVELDLDEIGDSLSFYCKNGPQNVIILTDVYCGSSGDAFVETCKKSSKVTVMGRSTKGLNDYSNIALKRFDNTFELYYPTSKSSKVDDGKGMNLVGIEPHVYIPWTPEHITKDIDLEEALTHLKKPQPTT
ncbi:S41 family peptidase [Pseudalkalibacillus berkeleyi]|uniref:S41 family peptidase n=1 Tax=Pseudalkalibacillus berkeleyi TaxID=1069813 RepID=A0ABS9GYU4_9BACL|nr:S41 family peptidase [Pseudalkalibacillus berkeleyi]MCF6136555.1 S41 family peptidase [Pseudalkalibacillus berkeleyi]